MPLKRRAGVVAVGLAVATAAWIAAHERAGGTQDPRQDILQALRLEIARSRQRLRLPGEEAPYFIRYLVRDNDGVDIAARTGALVEDGRQRVRMAEVEVRVGDYSFDNTADDTADGGFDFDDFDRYEPSYIAPIENDLDALRGALWLQTDARYKRALSALHKKRGRRVTKVVEDEPLDSFSREYAAKDADPPAALAFDAAAWRDRVRRVSAVFKEAPEIFDSGVKMSAQRQTRVLVTTEGTELVTERVIFGLQMHAVGRATDGLLIQHFKSVYGAGEADLPADAELARMARQLTSEVKALRDAPMLDPYNGPAILLPEAAGVFFHEALGHRLEGERQNDNKEGATFKGQLGKPILPTFISVIDDPTLRQAGKVKLNGHYRYDDEGVAARPVVLVQDGVLRNYLKSRTPVKGAPASNGHGRSEGVADPIGRMANTVVKSSKQVPYVELKRLLLAEIRRQKKAFGLIIADISGGQTNTTTYDFQAFKGMPRIVYKVDAKTGAETLVRGVEFVGTPIGSLNRIVATSDAPGVFNGYCGAESGYVPVSTVAPAILISEIELQRTRRAMERPPMLRAPWHDDPPAAPEHRPAPPAAAPAPSQPAPPDRK